ncbi:murein biosynthesis integral membrane protein MurJ [Proteiniclasticum sp.]|uniref:murein biosynthesis integral membrane protein MurJ n=1 Tax=Proteiniclasticum sp. TaxID=2053595 RepID=UPI0025E53E47|nr:murein biosynthesis integral membrane protein MurJ [Proteiniclasticum sp.]
MKKNIMFIMIITVFIKILGFGREIVLTYFYGASRISDVYLVAQTIPTTIFALIGAGLVTTFIPIYSKVQKEKGDQEAQRFSSNVMNTVVILSSVIILLVLVFTPQVILLFASGFKGETLDLAVLFTRISIFGIAFSGLIYILNAYLQLKDNFVIPALISLPMNLVLIFSIYLSDLAGIEILAYGILASVVIQLLFIIPSVLKYRFKYKLVLDFKDPYLREMLLLSIPIIIGTSVNQLNVLVDKNIASNVALGGISALNYAYRLNVFINGLFVSPIITVVYPRIAKKVIDGDESGLKSMMNDAILYISLLVIPASVGAMVLARPIIEFLFMRGEFDSSAAAMTSQALFYYALGMLAIALRDVFSRIFYSYKDTKTPTVNAIIGVVLNIILNLILSRFMGIGGLALATSLSAMITTLLLIISLRRKVRNFGFRETFQKLFKVLLASLLMGLVAYVVFESLLVSIGSSKALILSILVSGAVYLVLVILLKVPEVMGILKLFKEKIQGLRKKKG